MIKITFSNKVAFVHFFILFAFSIASVIAEEVLLCPYCDSSKGPTLNEEIASKIKKEQPIEKLRIVLKYGTIDDNWNALSDEKFQGLKSLIIKSICENITKDNTKFLNSMPNLRFLHLGFGANKDSLSSLPSMKRLECLEIPFYGGEVDSVMIESIFRLFPNLKRLGLAANMTIEKSGAKSIRKNDIELYNLSVIESLPSY
jgi:hypothetical protein